jgi:glycosyltransferase involved in cell wall biosynthesis
MCAASTPLPRLLVVKGTFEQFGGAERDLLNNLPAWKERFDVTLASLNLPKEARQRLDEENIPYLTPVREWSAPSGIWAEARALASRQAGRSWLSMLDLSEQITGLREVIANVDAIHVTSGVGSLEFTGLIPQHIPLHYYCLEPHRGLYENVLHRNIDGTPKRNLSITQFLLVKKTRRDQKFVASLDKRNNCHISGNSAWIQERISTVYGVDSELLLPTVDISTWTEGSGNVGDYVVTIGRASHVKGTWDTVDMLAGTGLSLALVGSGSKEDLAQLQSHAKKTGVALDIMPRLTQDDLVTLIKGARAVVSLAYSEPFGLTPIEAQAAGTPALMVDEGGFRYTVEDAVSGRLLPRGDWKTWHQALEQAEDPDTRKEWTLAGRANIKKMGLTPSNQATKLGEIFGFAEEE